MRSRKRRVLIVLGVLIAMAVPAAVVGCGGTATTAASTSQTSPAGSSAGSTATSFESIDSNGVAYTATDTSYTDATKSISITKATKGSGPDKITYFVADIKLASGKDLQAGLADNGQGVAYTSNIAAADNAIFAINGDSFGGDLFGDGSKGIIIRNGVIYRDKRARLGLALYTDGTMKVYDETQTSADQLLADGVWNTYSFGPALLIDGVVPVPDKLSTYEVVTNPVYPIQGRNPRTGIGLIDANHFVAIVVDGRHPGYSRGVTLEEFAQMFKDLGCTTAYNLDGGGSATMYFRGHVINSPRTNSPPDKGGQRGVSDILFVG
jgi:exopolysaccharide biosynthesis protein